MRLILVRHGATEWSEQGRHTGRTDLPLTTLGRAQARAAAPTLRELVGNGDGFAAARVVSSPLVRARETATIITGIDQPELDADLMEFDYGDYEGITRRQIQATRPDWLIWRDGCPGGESVDHVVGRADRFLASVVDDERTVIAVSHGHMVRFIATRALALDILEGHRLLSDTASISIIDDASGVAAIRLWNRCS